MIQHIKNCGCTECGRKYKKITHLHLHDFYSALDGSGKVEDYITIAKEHGHTAITTLNHGNMSGTYDFYKKCKSAGIQPILGMEAYLNDSIGKKDDDKEDKSYEGKDTHQSILIKDSDGYKNLNKLTYLSFTEGYYRRGRITTDWLLENKKGLITTSSCMASYFARLIEQGKEKEAEERIKLFKREFGDDFYAELQFNEIPEQKTYNHFILRMIKKYDLCPILTGDVHYAKPEDNLLQDIVISISQKTTVDDPKAFKLNARNLYYWNGQDFHDFNKKFGYNYPEDFIDKCLENTNKVAEKCKFEFETGIDKYPKFQPTQDVVNYFKTDDTVEIIEKLSKAKLKQKINLYKKNNLIKIDVETEKKYYDRLEYELKIIKDKGFCDYFLVLWELIRFCDKEGVSIGPGRGCFKKNSKVKMFDNSLLEIEKIKIGDKVIDAFGEVQKVIDVLKYNIEEEIIELNLSNGVNIECTLDHEILTNNRGWVAAKDLTFEDDIAETEKNNYVKLKNTKRKFFKGVVHDLTVENSHSYNIEGIGVHNSAAGCLLSWCLGIVKIDPVRFGLYFERFLNPERKSAVDIDVDFSMGSDEKTLNFLYEKYGKEKVVPVITFSTFSEKNTLKDVAKALSHDTGYSSDVFQVTAEMPKTPTWDINLEEWFKTWSSNPECSERVRNWLLDPKNDDVKKYTLKLQGQVRNWGKHAAGIVITPTPVWDYMPVNITKGQVVSGFQESGSGKDLSELGILKFDRLKLETLNVISGAIEYIKERKGIDIQEQIDNINIDDQNLYLELRMGNNQGVFQFESSGMNALIKGIQVENFEEVISANSLYRPGSMGVGAHEDYIKNKFNPSEAKYVHPILEPLLKDTNGVLIFQEQLMFIAAEIGGMTLGEGDMLRKYMDSAGKIIGKKLRNEQLTEDEEKNKNYKGYKELWAKFIAGAKNKGLNEQEVTAIEDWLVKYLGYSFNRCLTKNHIVIEKNKGRIYIDKVKIGDEVLGYNTKKGNNEYNTVKNIHNNGIKKVYSVNFSEEDFLECTLDHKILTKNGMCTLQEIINKNKNGVNLEIITKDKNKKILSVVEIGEIETMDLEIDSDDHNFYANDICVSNSHACCYSYLAMQTLFLKHYYPTEFYCALLNHPKSSTDKEKEKQWLQGALLSAMAKGIQIIPPTRKSKWEWTIIDDKSISIGFSGINGMGDVAYKEFEAKKASEMTKDEFFNTKWSKFNKKSFEVCLKAGIFDDWSDSREELVEWRNIKVKDTMQIDIFGNYGFQSKTTNKRYEKTSEGQKHFDLLEVCGLDLRMLRKLGELKKQFEEEYGMLIEPITNFDNPEDFYYFILNKVEEKISQKGTRMFKMHLSDGATVKTVMMWDKMYQKNKSLLQEGGVYVCKFFKDKSWLSFNAAAPFRKVF